MKWADLPPLSTIRAFEAAARHGSLTEAGAELNVTHAAISQQIRKLERHLEVALMERKGRGVALTAEGEALFEELSKGVRLIHDSLSRFSAERQNAPLQITTTPSFAAQWLIPRLSSFREQHPDIEFLLHSSTEVVDLIVHPCDAAIRFGDGIWENLASEKLLASSLVVVAAPQLLAGHTIRTPQDLTRLPWVQDADSGAQEWLHWLEYQGVKTEKHLARLSVNSAVLILSLLQGHGVGMITRAMIAREIEAGQLTVLFEVGSTDNTGYYLVWPKERERPQFRAFRRWLRGHSEPLLPS